MGSRDKKYSSLDFKVQKTLRQNVINPDSGHDHKLPFSLSESVKSYYGRVPDMAPACWGSSSDGTATGPGFRHCMETSPEGRDSPGLRGPQSSGETDTIPVITKLAVESRCCKC